ncbi:MAG: polysaccharide pyruvyl transferase family protein [Acidobacteria bacterium]|nr:polysaccharide pyruvyl transferase family protein [Acidobacteriota bacterium]
MPRKLSILLINDNSAHVNWGAQASPPSLLRILKDGAPDLDIATLPWDWLRRSYRRLHPPGLRGVTFRADGWPAVRPLLNRISTHQDFYPSVADDFDHFADEWVAGRGGPQAVEFLELAGRADVIVYNGENSIYGNTVEGCHGLSLLWLARTRLGKASCIVNHTAQLDDFRPIMKGMVKLVYPVLDLVAVREPRSLTNLQALGITKAELFPDVVFALDSGDFSRERVEAWRRWHDLGDRAYFCLSASGLPVSMPRGTWDGEVTALVRELKEGGLQAVLVAKDPWCLPLAEVARRTGSLFFGPEHEFHDLWPLFEGASFLVSGHYHYAIFAAMVGCPFVPLTANNHKMQGLCEHLGWHRTTPFDATSLRSCRAEIVDEARRLRHDRPGLSAHLLEKSATLRDEARRLGARVADVAQRAERNAAPVGGVSQ